MGYDEKVIQPYPMRQINKRVSFDAKKDDDELNVEQNKTKQK